MLVDVIEDSLDNVWLTEDRTEIVEPDTRSQWMNAFSDVSERHVLPFIT